MPFKSKSRLKAYKKRHYRKHKGLYIDRMLRRRMERKQWLADILKDLECVTCGENDSWCLEFHHKDPSQKKGSVSKMNHQMRPKKLVLAEMDKCVLLCANCHRKTHRKLYEDSLQGGQDHEC